MINITVSIMQPTFLPWAGYFNLIHNSDKFIFLDDVQLENQSWQTRNRILMNGVVNWISLPIKHENKSQKINETKLTNLVYWKKKFLKSFIINYSKHPYFENGLEIVNLLMNSDENLLSNLNQEIILFSLKKLNIKSNIYLSSCLNIEGVRTDKLIAICESLKATSYLSPIGSKNYLELDGFEENTNIKLIYQNYNPIPYLQKGSMEFISHLSILDIVSNLGWLGARNYIVDN
ncbi:WbqC family protein [Polynucleobacter rarus]|uniref:WbqC family protein n=1 Tax=Polynucleobacter rarus TaxID=556055 RepID=UPI00131F2FD7|nr:WbqC family protein [Polynucleobacter rarus]